MNAAATFFGRPRLLVLAIALVLAAGFGALEVLPRREDPELVGRFALVTTVYPGASAERVEAQVTDRIEEELFEIEEIGELSSTSSTGVSVVEIDLDETVPEADVDEVWSRVRDRLGPDSLALPAGALRPRFEDLEVEAASTIAALVWRGEREPSPALLARTSERLADVLREVPETKRTERFGEPTEEVSVEVDEDRLVALGLTVADVARALASGDAQAPAGSVEGASSLLPLEVGGAFESLADVADAPVTVTPDGRVLRVRDVGTVTRSALDPARAEGWRDGQRAVYVTAQIDADARVDRWAADVRAELDAFASTLPTELELVHTFDQSTFTGERLSELAENLVLGAVLVMLVILVTMGWRSALLVGSALPLSALMVLAGMRFLDVPIHQMSVTGLIIALGLLIDNAIVTVDEVRERWHERRDALWAASSTVRALFVPLLGSTVTTVLAFMPLVISQGPTGEFVGAMSISVILAVTSSFLLAMSVVPAVSARFLGRSREEAGGWWRRGLRIGWLTAGYRRLLEAAFSRPLLAALVVLALPALGFLRGRELTLQFFPPSGRDQARVELRTPRASTFARTRQLALAASDALLELDAVEHVDWVVGRAGPRVYYNQIGGARDVSDYAEAVVSLAPGAGGAATLRDLQARLDHALPAGQFLVRQFEQGPPFDAPVELLLVGDDLGALERGGEELRALLAEIPEVVHTRATVERGRAKLVLETDDEAVGGAGLDRDALAASLRGSLDGVVGGSLFEGGEELDVRVRLAPADRTEAASVAALERPAPAAGDGSRTPLDALGSLRLEPAASSISRRDGLRFNKVQAFLEAGALPASVVERALASLEATGWAPPAGVRLELGGESAERAGAVRNLVASAGILVVLMVATLVLAFQSFRAAGVIGVVAVASAGLAQGALWLFGHPFGFMAIVGTMGLVGIAINDSIVVLSAIRADERARAGDRDATVAVVLRASPHVVSTTLTTVAGFLPLLIWGDALWPPLAVSIAGGVSGATLLALFFVPAAHLFALCPTGGCAEERLEVGVGAGVA